MNHDDIIVKLKEHLGHDEVETSTFRDNVRVIVPAAKVYPALSFLKEIGFDMLIDITATDYLHYPDAKDRFGVVYCLLNTATGMRLVVKTFLNEPELKIPSVFPLWKGADWMEREVYDMFGIAFEGHPNLRRILLPEEFVSFPLRKDYPVQGKGERHNFPVLSRAES
ncbi:MAG: NADH-quinone oxidoreductase subunit C [Gemmatales bacterium]|nr:MAG: NADH-quinone oxidoreductase subunit C [Gemmatales bacterium]